MNAPSKEPALVNIATRLRKQAASLPNARAVVVPAGRDAMGRRCYAHRTFSQLDEDIDALAHGLLKMGVVRGTRTLLMVTPSIELFTLTFALQRIGAVPVLLDPAMGKANVLNAISEVEPEAFIVIPKGHVARLMFRKSFTSVKHLVTVGNKLGWGGVTLEDLRDSGKGQDSDPTADTVASDLAAILFTSGSTGAPKGVLYTHGIFDAQVRIFETIFGIKAGEVELSAFPLFSLFSAALGVTVVVPDMDATKPAQVEPYKIVEAIDDHGITYAFGSPAFWRVLAEAWQDAGYVPLSMRRVLMAGAPAPPQLLEALMDVLPTEADVFTPYGATECLPISLPSARTLLEAKHHEATKRGMGTCVGEPMPNTKLRIIPITDEPLTSMPDALPPGTIGEITVCSPVTTQGYFRRDKDNALSKIDHEGERWHRMGDVGWLDDEGRLWFCGRKSQRVRTGATTMFTACVEAIFNEHPKVLRTALVGQGTPGSEVPVLIVECLPGQAPGTKGERESLLSELQLIGRNHELTHPVQRILFHPSFPVDARHNAKIRREELRAWAEKRA